MAEAELDIICIGRSSVDLYGDQVGGRLEDMASFAKYVGGSPTNISIGAARLGLKSALITGVGNEHMGRFICETLDREGVDTSHVKVDDTRLTALVILGIRDREQFPLIFYRENCADMGLVADDLDEGFIASARAVEVCGTHLSTPSVAAMSRRAMQIARQAGRKVVLDIDYRPNLWALGGHGDGESRFAASGEVTKMYQTILPDCDLIVGTEEEWHIAGGTTDTLAALQNARKLSTATLVCKRGSMGCTVFPEGVSSMETGISVPVREIEVFNVLGAGDGFMAGFLRGWLRDEPFETCASYANACGALAVSRHGCAPAYPSFAELTHLLEHGSEHRALRHDAALERLHWSTTTLPRHPALLAFAFDHRSQLVAMADETGRPHADIGDFKQLALDAAIAVGKEEPAAGVLVDDALGEQALFRASGQGLWIGRPIEEAGKFPLSFAGGEDLGGTLATWPANHTVKVLAPLRLDDDNATKEAHAESLRLLAAACRNTRHRLLLEIITEREGMAATPNELPGLMSWLYGLGVFPDWWKLEPSTDEDCWQACGDVVRAHDPHMQGIIVLGKQVGADELAASFTAARKEGKVTGFAVGRNIFAKAAKAWLAGTIDDAAATRQMQANYQQTIDAWHQAGGGKND